MSIVITQEQADIIIQVFRQAALPWDVSNPIIASIATQRAAIQREADSAALPVSDPVSKQI